MAKMTRVLIVDDHKVMRDSFEKLFGEMSGFAVVGGTPNASFAEVFCERLHPDLVLMDVCTESGASGLDAAKRLRKNYPRLKIIIMSGFDEISYAPRAREIGADAFVYKSKSMDFFAGVIRDVMAGGTYFPESRTIPVPAGEAPLTEREMEVLRLLCMHKSRREIASELFISEMTVKRHVANMLEKTGFSSSVELAFYMITNGWINPMY